MLVPTSTARRNGIANTLAQFSTPNTRCIYYNTPQNPSGVVFTREEAEEVAAFAIERDLVVVADEAYEDLVYEGKHFSIASLPGMAERKHGVVINVIGQGGKVAGLNHLPGGAANAALMLATAGLAAAYGRLGIRVNAINPGTTLTARAKGAFEVEARRLGISEELVVRTQ